MVNGGGGFTIGSCTGMELYAYQAVTGGIPACGAPLLAIDAGCCQSGWVRPGVFSPVYYPMVLQH